MFIHFTHPQGYLAQIDDSNCLKFKIKIVYLQSETE